MLRITNKLDSEIIISNYTIPPHKSKDLTIAYDNNLRNMENNGLITVFQIQSNNYATPQQQNEVPAHSQVQDLPPVENFMDTSMKKKK